MDQGRIAELSRRGVVSVGGPDAEKFLNDLVTADISRAAPGQAVFAALLTPQGKVVADFIIFRDSEAFLMDVARSTIAEIVKRLNLYRLRARVAVRDLSDEQRVAVLWNPEGIRHIDGVAAPDPRLGALGWRIIEPADRPLDRPGFVPARAADYDAHRIALGIPEGGVDFAFGEVFPHDADMDQLGGIDFGKGCYVGQEVVSRMEHRGTARRRFVKVRSGGALPAAGAELTADGKPVGAIGSSAGAAGLALVRLDRAKHAIDAGTPIAAGAAEVALILPGWARFSWPAVSAGD